MSVVTHAQRGSTANPDNPSLTADGENEPTERSRAGATASGLGSKRRRRIAALLLPLIAAVSLLSLVSCRPSGKLGYPLTSWAPISSGFGMRWGHMHEGVDFAAPYGRGVRAANSGRVSTSGWVSGYGNYICVSRDAHFKTCYGHLSSRYVGVGQYVGQGRIIGTVGSTGHVTGPNLHFEVRINGRAVNPMPYL